MIGSAPICVECVHFGKGQAEEEGTGLTCAAFPKGIPDELLFGDHDHRHPFEGDSGIQFEAKPEEAS